MYKTILRNARKILKKKCLKNLVHSIHHAISNLSIIVKAHHNLNALVISQHLQIALEMVWCLLIKVLLCYHLIVTKVIWMINKNISFAQAQNYKISSKNWINNAKGSMLIPMLDHRQEFFEFILLVCSINQKYAQVMILDFGRGIHHP